MANQDQQTFNDGVVRIYSVGNVGAPGDSPKPVLFLKETLRYHERTVGINRYWQAQQNQAEVKYVLRCQRRRGISTQDVAIPNDGQPYRIRQIQYPEDIKPPVMDLTLTEPKQVYTIDEAEG